MSILHLKRRYKITLGIFLFIVIVLFAAPRIGCWYIVKHSHELIGRKLEINKIRINYFTGTIRIYGIKLFESDSKTVFLSLNRFKVNLDYLPLFRNEIFVKNTSLDDPFVEVLQNGDKFNFSDMMHSDTSAVVKKDTVPAEPKKYIINNIRINRGYVKYTDVRLNHTIALNKLDLLIPGFTWNSDSTNFDVNFRFVDGGGLYSNLELNQADSTYSLNLKLDSLNLDIIEPYLKSNMHISALHGYLSNDIKVKGNLNSIMQLTMKGIDHIYDFQLIDTMNRTIFSFKDLTLDINTLQPDKNKVNLNYISLTDPFFLFEMIDSTNNWLALMKPSPAETTDTLHQQADTNASTKESPYTFSKMEISGGKVSLSDKTLHYPFEYTIDNILMTSTPDTKMPGWIDVRMSAGLNGSGNLKAEFAVNPKSSADLDISVSVDQFLMKDVDAYFKHYFGFPVTGGRMNFSSQNKLRANSLVSSNSIYFRKFTLDKRIDKKTEYSVPLRLALGLLSDKNGIIDLKAPVEMKGKDVKIGNLRKIVFRAIGNLFVKAIASPYHLLADMFKVDPEKLQKIQLGLTEAAPDEKNLKTVDIIADILKEKPALNVDFIYCIDHAKAADSLAYIMVIYDYVKFNNSNGAIVGNVPDSILIKYLRGKTSSALLQDSVDISTLCRSYIGTERLVSKLDSLKMLQTDFISNYLTHDKEIPDDRFRIIANAPDTIKYLSGYPSFKIYFTAAGEKNN